jgi:hypothetical protein
LPRIFLLIVAVFVSSGSFPSAVGRGRSLRKYHSPRTGVIIDIKEVAGSAASAFHVRTDSEFGSLLTDTGTIFGDLVYEGRFLCGLLQ